MEIVELRRDGRLVAVVPLVRTRGLTSAATNWHSPEFPLLAADEAAAAGIAAALFESAGDRVTLLPLEADGPDLALLEGAAAETDYRSRIRELHRSPYLTIDGDWQRYVSKRRTRFFSELRRRARRLAEEGVVAAEIVAEPTHLDELLEEGFRIEGSGWKQQQGSAIASNAETAQFYREIACWALERGWLRLAFLRLDGRAIAFKYSLESGGTQYFLKGGYDPAYSRYSPAHLLQREVLERCFADGLTRYEFLGTEEEFKREWTDDVRPFVALESFGPSLRASLAWGARRYGAPLVKRVRAVAR
jgi:CelD/BcsL family acetyltransferase involved in cellulose biosynthesis